jgi:hypothetical protein
MSKKSKRKINKTKVPKVKKITQAQMDLLFANVDKSNLSKEDATLFKQLIEGNAWLVEQLELGLLSIAKLRKLFQIQGSEKPSLRKKQANQSGNGTAPGSPDKSIEADKTKKPKNHGRNGVDAYQGANVVEVQHPELSPGGLCPSDACGGKLYELREPGVMVRVTGAPLASATRYNLQKLRCSICEAIYTAPLPKGVSDKKYDNTFVSMLMINKYFMAMPLYRQDRLQAYLGMPLPASTQWSLIAEHEKSLKALHQALCQDAADGQALCYDDTSVKILSKIQEKKKAVKGEKSEHTCFTTGIVSIHDDHRTYVYMSNTQVSGAFMADILILRNPNLELPIVMCDALSANTPQGISEDLYILCYCLVHARRQFYELPDGYDDLADEVLRLIGKIYDHESYAKTLDKDGRLAYHKEHSAPVMDELKTYLEGQQKDFEENSVAGRAIAYVLKRFTGLSQFLRYGNAPIDNNIVEQALKLVIQIRKSSMFYKTLRGAMIASYIQSALYSAAQNNINPCVYMTALLDHEEAVITNPKAWLPWHYETTLKQIREERATQASSGQGYPDSG